MATTTMSRWATVAIAGAVALLVPARAACQKAPSVTARDERAQACAGRTVGSLGLTGWDCRGDCTLTLDENREAKAWSFSVEPWIAGVEPGGPADGILEEGDVIVAIDGLLITTAEGGARLANLPPDADVTVRFRRGGRIAEAVVHTMAVCGAAWEVPAPPLPPAPPAPADAPRVVRPRIRTSGLPPAPAPAEAPRPVGPVVKPPLPPQGLADPMPPRPRLGIGFTCTECGMRADPTSGREVWFFSQPPEVTAVDAGGPADRAGIQIGDRILAIDGASLTTAAGGRAFSGTRPGVGVRVTVAKRNGREETVTVMPEGREARGVTAPAAPTLRATVPAPPATPDPATLASPPAPPDLPEPPAGLPLRYSGTLAGVEVEVRGEPVMVWSNTQFTRTMVIWTDGLWIRIRVPASEGRSGSEGTGGTSERQGGT